MSKGAHVQPRAGNARHTCPPARCANDGHDWKEEGGERCTATFFHLLTTHFKCHLVGFVFNHWHRMLMTIRIGKQKLKLLHYHPAGRNKRKRVAPQIAQTGYARRRLNLISAGKYKQVNIADQMVTIISLKGTLKGANLVHVGMWSTILNFLEPVHYHLIYI